MDLNFDLNVKPDELFEQACDYGSLAIRDYLKRHPDGAPQPSCDPEITEENGEEYVVLENVNGVLAVYHIDTEKDVLSLTDYIPKAFRDELPCPHSQDSLGKINTIKQELA